MATLVTGGTGFVGSNIVRTLAERGHEVVCFDLVAPDALLKKYVEPWSRRIKYVQGDIVEVAALNRAAEGQDITRIVHAAVYTGIRPGIERDRSRSIVDINLVGTANLLDLARELSLERFLYVSSAAVYGDRPSVGEVLREDTDLFPRDLYAVTKYASELLTRRYGELHGFSTVSVRLGGPYGPMERVTGHRAVISIPYQWTGNVVRGEPLRVGDRTAARDFTYVADTAAAISTVLDAPALSYQEYNISSGRWITLDDLVTSLREIRPSVRVVDDPRVEFEILRPSASRGILDVSRLREDLGFKARYDLTSGMREYLHWRESAPFLD